MGEETPQSILVVDDDKNQRSMLAFALRDRGYRVVAVESGLMALERAKEEVFDAAICDIMMPGMNGVAALGQLKLVQPSLKIIMATGYATTALEAASLKGGASGYIAKPYDLKELFVLLDETLSGKGP